jgi:phosphate transport system permease protein
MAATFFLMLFLLGYICVEGIAVFDSTNVQQFLLSPSWYPLDTPGRFGILTMILSSFYVSALAVLFAIPIGVGCAVYCCFCLAPSIRDIFLSFIDMLAGVPSVIFGFIGLAVLVKAFEQYGGMSSGECILAGAILLTLMILPFIVTNCTDSMIQGRNLYEEASLNLGVDRWYTIYKIILPYTARAICASLILAFSRAMGETMAVMMVMGNSHVMPHLLGKGETIPALIALEMGSAEYGSAHYHALYASGMVLLVILVICNLLFYMLQRYLRKDGSR